MLKVLLRGLVAGPLLGATCGLLVVSPWALYALGDEPTMAPFIAGLGLCYGGVIGAAVGIPSAVVLALLSPLLRTAGTASTASLVVTATVVGLGLGSQQDVDALPVVVSVALVFGVVSLTVGWWVVLGRRERPRSTMVP